MKTKLCLNKLHASDKSCKTRSKHKPFYVLKWPMCDFEKQGSHLIITIKTGFCVEFVKTWIYCGLSNTAVYVKDITIRYYWPQQHFRFTKSSGNLEILTSIYIRQNLYKWGIDTRGTMFYRLKNGGGSAYNTWNTL